MSCGEMVQLEECEILCQLAHHVALEKICEDSENNSGDHRGHSDVIRVIARKPVLQTGCVEFKQHEFLQLVKCLICRVPSFMELQY